MAPLPLSVFIPSYNASLTISGVLSRIPDDAWEIIQSVFVINDGSQDDTEKVVQSLMEKYEKLQIFSFETNQGYGEVVRKGMTLGVKSGTEYVVCLHADGQYPPEKLGEFVEYMRSRGLDVLQGSRHKDGGALQGGMPNYKYAAGKLLTWLENFVFGLKMTDYHSGFLMYSRKALTTVPINHLSAYFDFDLEFIASARWRGLKIDELGIPTHYGEEKSYLNPILYGLRVLGILGKYVTRRYAQE